MDWFNDITINDIPPGQMSNIARECGIFDAVSLMRHIGGLQLYIPVYGKKRLNFDYIKDNYTGKNTLSIAVKLGIDASKVMRFFNSKNNFNKPPSSNNYMRLVVDKCGKGVANRLIEKFSGEKIYVPRYGYFKLRRRKIIQEFDGQNTSILALKYEVSERYVSKIIASSYQKSDSIQLNLFKTTA